VAREGRILFPADRQALSDVGDSNCRGDRVMHTIKLKRLKTPEILTHAKNPGVIRLRANAPHGAFDAQMTRIYT
jgi:hypothetical protein